MADVPSESQEEEVVDVEEHCSSVMLDAVPLTELSNEKGHKYEDLIVPETVKLGG